MALLLALELIILTYLPPCLCNIFSQNFMTVAINALLLECQEWYHLCAHSHVLCITPLVAEVHTPPSLPLLSVFKKSVLVMVR